MAMYVVAERPNMVLGLTYGVFRFGESKAICYCFTEAGATSIADALNAYNPIAAAESTMMHMSPEKPAEAMNAQSKTSPTKYKPPAAARGRGGSKKK
jgi:hypothetical protein